MLRAFSEGGSVETTFKVEMDASGQRKSVVKDCRTSLYADSQAWPVSPNAKRTRLSAPQKKGGVYVHFRVLEGPGHTGGAARYLTK